MSVLLEFLYFYICPVSVYVKKPVPVGAYLVGALSASTCGKNCKMWQLMYPASSVNWKLTERPITYYSSINCFL